MREPWRDDMFDGATFIGPLSALAGADDPPEWNGKGGPNYFHDKAYHERAMTRKQADDKWYELMNLAAEALPEPRRTKLLKLARDRYRVVRLVGWIWWMT